MQAFLLSKIPGLVSKGLAVDTGPSLEEALESVKCVSRLEQ